MCFPHNGSIVTIDRISFIHPHLMVNHPPSLYGFYMSVMFAAPQVNYVMTCPMHSTPQKRESLPSLDLYMVDEMVISLIGILEPNIPTLIKVVNMYSFQCFFLPSSKDLLEAMIGIYPLTCIPSKALFSWKP
jgi:hypothetical protein